MHLKRGFIEQRIAQLFQRKRRPTIAAFPEYGNHFSEYHHAMAGRLFNVGQQLSYGHHKKRCGGEVPNHKRGQGFLCVMYHEAFFRSVHWHIDSLAFESANQLTAMVPGGNDQNGVAGSKSGRDNAGQAIDQRGMRIVKVNGVDGSKRRQ